MALRKGSRRLPGLLASFQHVDAAADAVQGGAHFCHRLRRHDSWMDGDHQFKMSSLLRKRGRQNPRFQIRPKPAFRDKRRFKAGILGLAQDIGGELK